MTALFACGRNSSVRAFGNSVCMCVFQADKNFTSPPPRSSSSSQPTRLAQSQIKNSTTLFRNKSCKKSYSANPKGGVSRGKEAMWLTKRDGVHGTWYMVHGTRMYLVLQGGREECQRTASARSVSTCQICVRGMLAGERRGSVSSGLDCRPSPASEELRMSRCRAGEGDEKGK